MRAPATALPTPIPAAALGAIDFEGLDVGVFVLDEFFALDMTVRDETPSYVPVEELVVVVDESLEVVPIGMVSTRVISFDWTEKEYELTTPSARVFDFDRVNVG